MTDPEIEHLIKSAYERLVNATGVNERQVALDELTDLIKDRSPAEVTRIKNDLEL